MSQIVNKFNTHKWYRFDVRLFTRIGIFINVMLNLTHVHVLFRNSGRYSIYTWTWNVNVKREREKSNKRFSIVCIPYRRERDVNVKRGFMTCDRETRAWNRSLHVAIFHVHAQHSRARNKNKKTFFYARGNRETNWIHHKCPVLYEQSLK